MEKIQKMKLEPGLYVISTPIGNLDDITIRALNTLNSVDIILCENTRNSIKLLSHYNVKTKLSSYNDHSSQQDRNKIIRLIAEGKSVALISDAGTPLISDPGYKLIRELHQHELLMTSIPGPCSAINALVLAGVPTDKFIFEGFLPIKQKDRISKFADILSCNASSILFDTSKKIESTLRDIQEFFGDIEIVILREMTKKFEERLYGKVSDILSKSSKMKGELVLIIPPQNSSDNMNAMHNDLKKLRLDNSNSSRDIVKILTFKYPEISKKLIYDIVKK
ncbi:MAG: 16S rRNA (cytidine(1402)-2'-O)-methyltransferase [Alphaproteobacteria bacterium]|nr:16S rRNA (cytidine(1402)-2'-O)-methyltransferase [Alphaproteobacteria bacterium]